MLRPAGALRPLLLPDLRSQPGGHARDVVHLRPADRGDAAASVIPRPLRVGALQGLRAHLQVQVPHTGHQVRGVRRVQHRQGEGAAAQEAERRNMYGNMIKAILETM